MSAIHANYIKKFHEHDKVTLISNISNEPVSNSDVFVKYAEISLIQLPAFSTYSQAIKYFIQIYRALKKAAEKSSFIYVRTPEPFSWLLALWRKKCTINYHYVSNPIGVILKNEEHNIIKRYFRAAIFMPEFTAISVAALLTECSCNGQSVISNIPFYLRKKIKILIESTKTEADFKNQPIKKTTSSNRTIRFLTVTRFFPAKGLDALILAFKEINNLSHHDYKLILVGEGPLLEEIKLLSIKYGIFEKIDFLGYVKNGYDLDVIYNSCDVFINPSLSETGPRVLLEALANNLYCISTDVGYARHVMTDDHGILHGKIIPPGCVNELTTSISSILNNPQYYLSNTQHGFNLSKRFTVEKFISGVLGKNND